MHIEPRAGEAMIDAALETLSDGTTSD
jgi:hypothetical protein